MVRLPETAPPHISSSDSAAQRVAVPIVGNGNGGLERKSSLAPPAPSRACPTRRANLASVLRAKVQPPPLRTSTLSRQRLIDRLAAAAQSRVTLIVADAGYGKTTLLADFSRRFDGTCLWYSLESSDGDWFTVINHLLAAAREAQPDFGEATASLLRSEPGMPPPKAAATGSLLQELEAFDDERTVLILDDVHNVDENADAKELLLRLMREAPRNFSFVLTSRHRPSLALARWAGMGELVELTTDDLRFSPDETSRLFSDGYGRPLEPDILDEVDRRLRGWAACLQLFSTRINGLSPSAVRAAAESLSGSKEPLYEYLAQEVVANLSVQLQAFLTRAAILQVVTPERLEALFPDERENALEAWTAESDALGLLTRASQSGASRHFHPLMREFLLGELRRRDSPERIAEMHADVARASEDDPLTACQHYIEAALLDDAMRCLGSSTLQTMGSGRWGTAAQLAARLNGQPHNGAVAAIQARRLLEEGDLASAASVLRSIDIGREEDPIVRAVLRHTLLVLSWRTGNADDLATALTEIRGDAETPPLLREIAQVFVDASTLSERRIGLSELCDRLQRMAARQETAGYGYYSAISVHNAATTALHAGDLGVALRLGDLAIRKFEALPSRPTELYSAHAVIAAVSFELGRNDAAQEHIRIALSSGTEHADVHVEVAYLLAVVGDRRRATTLLRTAEDRDREGLTDIVAKATAAMARAYLKLPLDPAGALEELLDVPADFPLNLGYDTRTSVLRSLAHLLAGNRAAAARVAEEGRAEAERDGSSLRDMRLRLVGAMATENDDELRMAVSESSHASALALLEVADGLGDHLHMLTMLPDGLAESIAAWPARWRPVLRRQLARGDDARAHIAAGLLDRYGSADDVGRLRAFEKTYRRKRTQLGLGRNLSRRVSPKLGIHDLGQVSLTLGERTITLGRARRKPGALLMYLVTRPNFTATRDQIVEDLWPDGETSASLNSLNQSLYFIRREIDPWYEDDLSPEYVSYQAELVSLDHSLVEVDSAAFVTRSRELMARSISPADAAGLLDLYRGQFSPEFEYEEWAIPWRTRVHAAYLDFAAATIVDLAKRSEYRSASDIALRVLSVDPTADDIERKLIWLYWRTGARSAASAHHGQLNARERSDGFDPTTLEELVSPPRLA